MRPRPDDPGKGQTTRLIDRMRVPRATFLVSLAAAVITLIPPAAVPAGAAPRPALPQLPQARLTVAAGLLGVDTSPNVRVDATPGPQVSDPAAGIIETFAGGSADGATAPFTTFKEPYDAVVAPDGAVVVADTYDNRIRRIDPATGAVSTIVGTGDAGLAGDGGPATQASLNFPIAAAYGPDGSLYVADRWNDRVRKVDPNTATITTVAGNGPDDANGGVCYTGDGVPATSTALCGPSGIAVAPNGNLFIADTGNDRIRMVDASTGLITTVAGNGLAGITQDGVPPTSTYVNHPWGIVLDSHGNPIFSTVDDYRIRYVNLLDHPVTLYAKGSAPLIVPPNTITTIAGGNGFALDGTEGDGGPATLAQLTDIHTIQRAANGDLLITEDGNSWDGTAWHYAMRVRRISWRTGVISEVAGNSRWGEGADGVKASRSALSYPEAAFALPDGDVGIVDRGNSRIRVIDHLTGLIATPAGHDLGDGLPAPSGRMDQPWGIAAGTSGVYVTDGRDVRIRRVDPAGVIHTAAGSGPPCVLAGVAFIAACERDLTDGALATKTGFPPAASGMDLSPEGMLAVTVGGEVWAVNEGAATVTLYPGNPDPIQVKPGHIALVAGGGGTKLSFGQTLDARQVALAITRDVTFASNGDLLLAETTACRVDRVDASTGMISVVAGQPCSQLENYLDGPTNVARFYAPFSVAQGADGSLYVADTGNGVIRRIDASSSVVSTYAGTPEVQGFAGDGGPRTQAEFAYPSGVRFAPDGSLIVTDALNDRVRRIATDATGTVTTLAGSGPSYANAPCGSEVPCGHYAGDGGPATEALLNIPLMAVVMSSGELLIADQLNDRVRMVQIALTP